jgi:hypothetical protein
VICHTDGCPAAQEKDEFERPVSVQHGGITQSVLGATGHHLLNRQREGTLETHLRSWSEPELRRASADVRGERERVLLYLDALTEVLHAAQPANRRLK